MPVKESTSELMAATLVPLTPAVVERMIEERQMWQIMKFRTTCTDCVPNY